MMTNRQIYYRIGLALLAFWFSIIGGIAWLL